LIPSSEKENILGVIWDSSVFPQQNYHDRQTRLTVILKNKHPNDCLNIALAALSKHLSINQTPNVFHIHTAQSAIPQYGIGHEERLKKMRSTLAFTHPRLTLSGSSFYGVSIPDCIKHSEFVAQTIELD
jgi:oxygen-dependent protoporphyrinogen oxidase